MEDAVLAKNLGLSAAYVAETLLVFDEVFPRAFRSTGKSSC
jgi:hypothetical protein